MSLIPEIPNMYVESFVVGLLYGLVFCTSACLPFIASYIAGIGANFRKGVFVTLIFNSGRIAAYALIGGLIGIFASAFRFVLSETSISPFRQYSSYAFGIVTMAIGVSILFKSRSTSRDCNQEGSRDLGSKKSSGRFDLRAFSLGFSRGLIVCPPLLILLLYSIPFGAPIDGLASAVLFGLGTAFSPLLLLGGVTGWLLNKAPLFKKWISLVGAGILILLGIATIANAIIIAIT